MRLTPQSFWAMSLPEWRACIGGYRNARAVPAAVPLARRELDALMERYPDD